MYKNYNHIPMNTMNVSGIGKINVKPDIAILNIGVETENKELSKAQYENSITTTKVIDSIKNNGVTAKDIQTAYYNIVSVYDYSGSEKIFKGYKVTNMLKVRLREVEKTGKVIDNAVDSGANIINNIQFDISNKRKYYEKALQKAIRDAVSKAEAMSYEMNVVLNTTPIKITEEQGSNREPVLYSSMEYSKTTPIEPGIIGVNAKVKATFAYLCSLGN